MREPSGLNACSHRHWCLAEACSSTTQVLRQGGHGDTAGEDARNPRGSGALCLALSPGGAVAHDRGVRRALLEGVHAAPAPPLGRAEGGLPVLGECIVWHHTGLSTGSVAKLLFRAFGSL